MSRLRTLFVIDELDIGGTEQQILETVRRIDRDRFEPFVCCFRHGAKASEIEALGVPVIHEPKRLKADPGLVLRLAALMRRERFDIVQTYLWTANTWARVAARLAGVRWVLASERNVDIWEEAYKRVVGRFLARGTDRIIANSEAVRQYLLERGGLAPEKVVTIYNGVNFDRFRAACDPAIRRRELGVADDVVLAGCLARIEPAKDHGTLLQALALVSNRLPKLHLVLIGGGSEEERLQRRLPYRRRGVAAERGHLGAVVGQGRIVQHRSRVDGRRQGRDRDRRRRQRRGDRGERDRLPGAVALAGRARRGPRARRRVAGPDDRIR
jgi:glycosyltransferase involved in cell wall biosynthesis